jgi:tetratricopeptide (TPR) repeat protein
LYPDYNRAHFQLAFEYEEKGLYAPAVGEFLKYLASTGGPPERIEVLRRAFAASGIRGFWEKRLELEKRQVNPDYFSLARLCVQLGRTDEAFEWLEKAYTARNPNMPNLKVAVWLDPVRADPRYTDLVRRVGLSP